MWEAINVVKDFYGLEALFLEVSMNHEFNKHSHCRLYADLKEFRAEYISKVKSMLFDYSVAALFGESRHAQSHSTFRKEPYPCYSDDSDCHTSKYDRPMDRHDVYSLATNYDPIEACKVLEQVFSDYSWDEGYGGRKWGMVANVVKRVDEFTDVAFCDACFSLSHNSSPYLDKTGIGIFKLSEIEQYIDVLDFKFAKSPIDFLSRYYTYFSSEVKRYVKRAISLGLVKIIDNESLRYNTYYEHNRRRKEVTSIFEYTPKNWGRDKLKWEGGFDRFEYTLESSASRKKEDSNCPRIKVKSGEKVFYKQYGFWSIGEVKAINSPYYSFLDCIKDRIVGVEEGDVYKVRKYFEVGNIVTSTAISGLFVVKSININLDIVLLKGRSSKGLFICGIADIQKTLPFKALFNKVIKEEERDSILKEILEYEGYEHTSGKIYKDSKNKKIYSLATVEGYIYNQGGSFNFLGDYYCDKSFKLGYGGGMSRQHYIRTSVNDYQIIRAVGEHLLVEKNSTQYLLNLGGLNQGEIYKLFTDSHDDTYIQNLAIPYYEPILDLYGVEVDCSREKPKKSKVSLKLRSFMKSDDNSFEI